MVAIIASTSIAQEQGIVQGQSDTKGVRPIFEDDIFPLFKQQCVRCHGGKTPKGGLSLENIQSVVNGGLSGRVLISGKAEQSYLYHRVRRGEMPPDPDKRLSEGEVEVIKRWIEDGLGAKTQYSVAQAKDPVTDADRKHWAFKRIRRSQLDSIGEGPPGANGIDVFIQQSLAEAGLQLAPPARRATLLRRVYLDLIGIPPTPEQLDHFLTDSRPDAYEQVVGRLLASPQFGPRWGRHWLDVAGYADVVGFDHTPSDNRLTDGKWRYRDYVIDAFNRDMPYTQFVREQVAGDELFEWKTADEYTPNILRSLIATGFLRTARDQSHEAVGVVTYNFYATLHDTTEIMIGGLLGISIQCVRCHDHKYDAFTQSDYYRIQACLMPSYNPTDWRPVYPFPKDGKQANDRSLPDVSEKRRKEITENNAKVHGQIALREETKSQVRELARKKVFAEKLTTISEQIRGDVKIAVETTKENRSSVQSQLVEDHGSRVDVNNDEIDNALNEAEKTQIHQIDEEIHRLKRQVQGWKRIQVLYDVGEIPTTFILKRGEFENPGRPVEPGFPTVLSDSPEEAIMTVPEAPNGSSGRRLGLARWLTEPDSRASALLARVIVNRIWYHLFGRGIVETTGGFGVQGTGPSHPELLEWLCLEFQRNNWQVKPLIRAMVTSNAYRQSSHVATEVAARGQQVDPDNELYWHMPLRRLESESVRDSLLSIGNRIDLSLGGPPVWTTDQPDGRIVIDPDKLKRPSDAWKRSVYLLTRRGYHLTLLDVFDQPGIETTCNRRQINAVAQQSLTMLNDQFVYDQAQRLARQITTSAVDDVQYQITHLYRRILCRPPDDHERYLCAKAISALRNDDKLDAVTALTEVCHTVLNSSEFLYRE